MSYPYAADRGANGRLKGSDSRHRIRPHHPGSESQRGSIDALGVVKEPKVDGASLLCTCGEAIRVWADGSRVSLYDQRPHLDHSAYQDWARRWGFTLDSLGWLYEVVNYPASIRDHIVSPRMLQTCGLLPGVAKAAPPTTAGASLTRFSAEHPWDDLPSCPKRAPEPAEVVDIRFGRFFAKDDGAMQPNDTSAVSSARIRWGK